MRKQILKVFLLVIGLAAASLVLHVPQSAWAANPTTMNFQGKVTNHDGTNVVNGSYNFDFILYDDPALGSPSDGVHDKWHELSKSVTVTNGVFQTELGSATALPDFNANPALYLAIRFNGDAAGYMSPRIHLTSVPYAFNSDRLGGLAAGDFVQLQGTTPGSVQTGNLNIDGAGIFGGLLTSNSGLGISTAVAPTADLVQITNAGNDSTTDGVAGLSLAFGVANASGDALHITPSFTTNSGGIYNGINIDPFTATRTAGGTAVNGLNIGALTESGVLASAGINIDAGWDNGIKIVSGISGGNSNGISISTPDDLSMDQAIKNGINVTPGSFTESAGASTGRYTGINVGGGGTSLLVTSNGTINWTGNEIGLPDATVNTNSGVINNVGLKISTGSITQTTGTITESGIFIDTSTGTRTFGTLDGIKIGNISGGTVTSTALKIGSGWNTDITTETGTNADLTLSADGSGSVVVKGDSNTGLIVNSTSANSFAVGPTGATPALQIDASTGSLDAGLKITGATAAGTVTQAVISSGGSAGLSINAKGIGILTLQPTATGDIQFFGSSYKITSAGALTVSSCTGCGGGSVAFSSITAGTNANALIVGTSGSLTTSGSGTITANQLASSTSSAAGLTLSTSANGDLSLAPNGSGNVKVTGDSDTGLTITSAFASSIAVGPNGATNPVLQVDSSTGSQAAGLKFTGATAAGTVVQAVISSGSNAGLSIDAKGTGTLTLQPTATGDIQFFGSSYKITSAGALTVASCTGCGGGSVAFSSITAGTNANALVIGTSGSLTTSGSGTITATDLGCSDCVALTTETTGNYVASVANGTGITGGGAGSEGAALTLSIDQSAALTWTGTETFNQGTGKALAVAATAASTVDQVTISNSGFASATNGVDGLAINFGSSNASGDALHIIPSYAGGATDSLTYNGLEFDAFSPTNSAGTDYVNGIRIGALTDPGTTISSTGLDVGGGWDTGILIRATDVGLNVNAESTSITNLVRISNTGGTESTTDNSNGIVLNFGTSNASGTALHISPTYTGGATDNRTFNIIGIDGLSPTNSAGTDTVNGINIGALTDPGATITSTALNIGTGWDVGLSLGSGVVVSSGTTDISLTPGGNLLISDGDGTGATYVVRIGTSTDNVTFGSGFEPVLSGNARHTRAVLFAPEFAGAVLTGDGANNTGTMTSDFCSGSSALNINASICDGATTTQHNYYNWTSTAANDYEVWIRWKVPSDFSAFVASNPINWNSRKSATGDDVKLNIYSITGTLCGTGTSMTNTAGSWQSTNYTSSGCTPSAGDTLMLDIHMAVAANGNSVQMGGITISYLSKW